MSPEQQRDADGPAPDVLQRLTELRETIQRVREEMGKIIVGQEHVIEKILIAILVRGHCLLEGVPGLAKTLMVRTLAEITDLKFKRIQFTPDLIPSDILGSKVLDLDEFGRPTGGTTISPGPIFTNVVLGDEINRASPKTQSALLEAMEERQVTIGDKSPKLPKPFFVLATQNPIEQEGTYPLPEAQLDRFLFKLDLNYPEEREEIEIVQRSEYAKPEESERGDESEEKEPVEQKLLTGEQIRQFQQLLRAALRSAPNVRKYAVGLVRKTRPDPKKGDEWLANSYLRYGAGPRASIALIAAAKAHAVLHWQEDGHPIIDQKDVKDVAPDVLRHRIRLNYDAVSKRMTPDKVIDELLKH